MFGIVRKPARLICRVMFAWRAVHPVPLRLTADGGSHAAQATPSWFVRVTAIKDKLLANNAKTHWVPSYVKEKRFHNWLEVRPMPHMLKAAPQPRG